MSPSILILLMICHWLADYTHLSTDAMLKAKRSGTPIWPIWLHASTHGTLMGITLVIMLPFNDFYRDCLLIFELMAFQTITHFFIDLLKGKINIWHPPASNPVNKIHWYIFGLDQLLHGIVIVIMTIYIGK